MQSENVVKGDNFNSLYNKLVSGIPISILIFLSIFPAHSAEKTNDIGFVLGSKGTWLMGIKDKDVAPESISAGRSLPAGAKISAQNPHRSDYIEIVLINNKTITVRCDEITTCREPLDLPQSLEKQSTILARISDAVRQVLLQRNTQNMVLPLARGRNQLQDAVIKIEDGKYNLAPVFSKLDAGFYYLSFSKIAEDEDIIDQDLLNPVYFKWDPKSKDPIKLNGLEPGLYHLTLMRKYGRHFAPQGEEAWVLFVKPEDYEEANANFQEALSLTKEWDADISYESVRNFLLAYLESLNDQIK